MSIFGGANNSNVGIGLSTGGSSSKVSVSVSNGGGQLQTTNHFHHLHQHHKKSTNDSNIHNNNNKEKLQAFVSIHEVFRDFDTNCDGLITAEEIHQIVGNELAQEEIEKLIQAVNKKKDGKVNFKEFIQMMSL
jgi:hypothetical protein